MANMVSASAHLTISDYQLPITNYQLLLAFGDDRANNNGLAFAMFKVTIPKCVGEASIRHRSFP